MKSSYLELPLQEFLGLQEFLYDIDIYDYLDNITKGFDIERVKIIFGDIHRYSFCFHETDCSQRAISMIENKIKEIRQTNLSLNDFLGASTSIYGNVYVAYIDIDIYNYLDNITKGFDIERVKIILGDIERAQIYLRDMVRDEFREWNSEFEDMASRHKWTYDVELYNDTGFYYDIEFEYNRRLCNNLNDYGFNVELLMMHNIVANWNIPKAINMLKEKLQKTEQISINQLSDIVANWNIPKYSVLALQEDCKKIIPDNIWNELEKRGFIGNAKALPVKWLKSKALLAYFVDVANDKLNLKHGEKQRIRPFEMLFGVSGLVSAKNDYKKTGGLPVDYGHIDKLFP
jgi:hypothetical protein